MNSANKDLTPKTSKVKNKNYISSGNLFLDKITGGLSLGTLVLLVEDTPSSIYEGFLKYYIAEGIVNSQKTFFYYNNETIFNNIIKNLPYKSTQVESILNAKSVKDTKSSEMKIAWRYENIKYSNVLEDIIKSTNYIFDLSRQLQDVYISDKNKDILVKKFIEPSDLIENNNKNNIFNNKETQNQNTNRNFSSLDYLASISQNIIKDYQEYTTDLQEDEVKIARFAIANLFYDDVYANSDKNTSLSDEYIARLKAQLSVLKNIIRSINGVAFITVSREFLNSEIFKILFYYCDYVFTLKSFILDPQKLEDYDGLFYINKLPKACTMKSDELETDTFGVIIEKRKIVIEKIDIGVEIDRNTKVKEKDLPASQAICGQEKYSKNYEF